MGLKILLVCLLTCTAFCYSKTAYKIGFLNEESIEMNIEHSAPMMNFTVYENVELKPWTEHIYSNDSFSVMNLTCHMISNNVMAIFGPRTRKNVEIVQNICSAKEIPNILTSYVGPLKEGTEISLYPNIHLLQSAYIDIISNLEWDTFTILYVSSDINDDFSKLTNIFAKAQHANIAVDFEIINSYENADDVSMVFERLKMSKQKSFLIDCTAEHIIPTLRHFQRFGMVTDQYNYFFTNIDPYYPWMDDTFRHSGATFTLLTLTSEKIHKNNFKCLSEALVIDGMEMFSNALNMLEPVENLKMTCKNNESWRHAGTQLINYMLTSSYNGITGQITFGEDRYRNKFKLYIDKVSNSDTKQIGTWSPLSGLKYTEFFSKNQSTNIPLVVMTLLMEPYVMLKHSTHPLSGNDRYEGFVIDLIEEISKINNFTYTIVISERGAVRDIIEHVKSRFADLAIADITITNERLDEVEFTHPFLHTGISILFHKPVMAPPGFFYFARPFSEDVWVAIVIALVIVTASLFIIGRLCPSEWKRTCPKSTHIISQLTFCDSIWFVTGSLFRQNTRTKISSVPGRIVAASWWFLCCMLIAMYIAGLLAHRPTRESIALFSDVQSLARFSDEYDVKYGAKMDSATMHFFRDANNPTYQMIYQHMVEHPEDMVRTVSEGVNRAKSSRYAFFTEETVIDYEKERNCNLEKYGPPLSTKAYGIAVKNNTLRTSLSTAILKLSSSGKLDKLKKTWWGERRGGGMCNELDNEEEYVTPVSITEISSLMYILWFGVTLAAICGFIEFLNYVYNSSKKLEVPFLKIFNIELKQIFRQNVRKAPNSDSSNTPEDKQQAGTSELVELS